MSHQKSINRLRSCLFLLLVALFAGDAVWAEVSLVIDKPAFRLTVLDGADTLAQFPIAVGQNYGHKHSRGDMKTPEGTFTIRSIEDSRKWGHDFKDGNGYIRGAYGPWFLRLTFGYGIGIHGTHNPGSMGKRATEGCIRLRNDDLQMLHEMVKVGTQVQILPDPFSTPWTSPSSISRKKRHEPTGSPIGMPAIPKQEILPAAPFAVERDIEIYIVKPRVAQSKHRKSRK